MKIPKTILVSLLTASVASAAAVSAATFIAFPPLLSCDIVSGTATWSAAELEAIAKIGIKQRPFEKSAANIGSGRCSQYKLPYYATSLGKGAGSLYFVYDSKTKAFEFCNANTVDLNGDGYPDFCSW